MRKHWTFAFVLLVALAGCGDKKAEQAKGLQQELQDLLAKAAGTDKKITYGDVAVTPDGDVFDASIDKLAVPIAGSAPIDLGKITFKIAPSVKPVWRPKPEEYDAARASVTTGGLWPRMFAWWPCQKSRIV